jgi:cellobiose phosphorylase
MGNNLWKFADDFGSFESKSANRIKALYFPLTNERIMSSISPDLHGDIKTGQDSFLLAPTSRIDLLNLRSSRNFWVTTGKGRAWSVTGVSKDLKQINADDFTLRAGLLWQEVTRANKKIGLEARILSFVPVSGEPVEVMRTTLINTSSKKIEFVPTAAIPIYGRGANNLRDHRHVTSLLQRPKLHRFGVTTKPTLAFDEAGHRPNKKIYFVLGWDDNRKAPQYVYPTEELFCGDGGDLEAPEAVLNGRMPPKGRIEGEEPMGALRFRKVSLKPGEHAFYTIVMGISDNSREIESVIKRLGDPVKLQIEFMKTRERWTSLSEKIRADIGDGDFGKWFRWVAIQPTLRRIYGCSFLPDFDYGKGGRGWRDLWQDCLGLILSGPDHVRGLLLNNFSGVRIDGSNATIIGRSPGEFLSDRNNISRVWMDHGVWPLITLDLYLNEIGDFDILFEEAPYFRNHEVDRASRIDPAWCASAGRHLKTRSGKVYKGTVLEHLLVQNLVQFFNVGAHNHVRLEGADWNDGLDMAKENGESVAFSAMYAHNLALLDRIIEKTGRDTIALARELAVLFKKTNYNDAGAKRRVLAEYFENTRRNVSGAKVEFSTRDICAGLSAKAGWMMEHIRGKEWLKEGFFNGYYDNKKRRVEGKVGGIVRMMLSSQVFPIMGGAAEDWQIADIMKSVRKYLRDKKLKGFRLNTDFKDEQHDLGRAFSFIYGDKENGAFFNHMVVMFAYALYQRGYAKEGWQALSSIYAMAKDTERSKIYPCLPEYFNLEGRGMYTYLTGSASWFMLTILTQVFGVKGKDGDLAIEPKLCSEHFRSAKTVSVERPFAGRRICVNFSNPKKLDWDAYSIRKAWLNGRDIPIREHCRIIINRKTISALPAGKKNIIDIILG